MHIWSYCVWEWGSFIVVITLSHKNNRVWSCWHALELVCICVLVIFIDTFGMFDMELLHTVIVCETGFGCALICCWMSYFVALVSKYIFQFFNVYAITYLPWRFLFSDLLWDYWVEHVTMEHSCIKFTFPARLCSGFVTACPCCVWSINRLSPLWCSTFPKLF